MKHARLTPNRISASVMRMVRRSGIAKDGIIPSSEAKL